MKTPKHLFIHTAQIIHHHYTNINGDTIYADQRPVTIDCRVQVLSGTETIAAGGDRTMFMAKLYCDPSANILNEDHIIFEGRTYRDLVVREPDSMSVYKVVDMVADIVERA